MIIKPANNETRGWKGFDPDRSDGLVSLMRDGDQQLFNPYGHPAQLWTTYSFRPCDTLYRKPDASDSFTDADGKP